jgi:hypothetical protein
VEGAAPIDSVPAVATALAEMIDAREVTFLIADFSGRAVVRLTSTHRVAGARSHGVEQAETLPLAGTVYDRVLRTQQADVQPVEDGAARMVVPVTDRGDAIGLLELVLPGVPSIGEVADIGRAAHALAYVLIAARRHTDVFEWGMRSTAFSLAAEIQRRLLPASYTCEAGQFTLAGWLEPAASVGGDTFDYTLERDSLQVSITDAVGHEVAASLLALSLVGATAFLVAPALVALGLFAMGMAPSLQYRVVSLAGPGGALAQSLPASAANAGIAVGSVPGGVAFDRFDASATVITGLIVALVAVPVAWATSSLKPPVVEEPVQPAAEPEPVPESA